MITALRRIVLTTAIICAASSHAQPAPKIDNSWFYAPEVTIAGVHLNISFIQRVYLDGTNLHIYTLDNHFVEPYSNTADANMAYRTIKTQILERVCGVIVDEKNKRETVYPWTSIQAFANEENKTWIQQRSSNNKDAIDVYPFATASKICL